MNSIKSYELHTAPNRRQLFNELQPKVWRESDMVRQWVVADPEICIEMLRSSHLVMPDQSKVLDLLEKATGQSFENLRLANRFLPAFMEGPEHAELRRGLATYLMSALKRLDETLPALTELHLSALKTKGIVDIYNAVARPFVCDILSTVIGQKLPNEILNLQLGNIFPLYKSPAQWRQLNADYGVALEFLHNGLEFDEMELACKLCCLTFGVDSLCTLIVEAMLELFASEMPHDLPIEFPREAGVPVTFRYVREDCKFGEHEFSCGDFIRLQIQATSYSENNSHHTSMFGAGMHSCVGRQLSLKIWRDFAERVNELGLKGEIVTRKHGQSHFWTRYNAVEVRLM